MLQNWTELLPLFVIRHLAQKCETLPKNGMLVKVPRPGLMIQVEAPPKPLRREATQPAWN